MYRCRVNEDNRYKRGQVLSFAKGVFEHTFRCYEWGKKDACKNPKKIADAVQKERNKRSEAKA